MAIRQRNETAHRVLIVAADAGLRDAAVQALDGAGWGTPHVVMDDAALLAAVVDDRFGYQRVFLQDSSARLDTSLLDALAEASPQAIITVLSPDARPGEIRGMLDEEPSLARLRYGGGGLRPDGLMLRYQPIICLRTGRLLMVEALARWASEPVALTPVNFIPAMERMGLGKALAGAVARMAARDVSRLRPAIGVSVNLGVAEFCAGDVVGWLGRQLRRTRMPRPQMAIELTETSPVIDRTRLRRSLRRLRAAGHDVMMDDYIMNDPRRALLRLPFSGVKLDRALVQQMPTSARVRQEIRALARLGLTITAEGVSSPPLWRGLRHLGVARVQGFLVARPLPIAALPAWARKWRAAQPLKARP
ncbi:MAG TPA: EAL domain-containing protein [Roseococcus sp.]|nr:EAL domain-containing protein [Roseococcus sp.]